MNALLLQAALHFGARLLSVGLSFVLFSWIAHLVQAEEASRAYSFTYAFGFALATIRMALQLGAGIDGTARLTERFRSATRGYETLRRLLPILAIVVATTTWIHTQSLLLTLLAVLIAIAGAPDVDLIRGLSGKSSIFSTTFAAGTVLSLVLLQWVLPQTLNSVIFALLCQWLPVCISNISAWRHLKKRRLRLRRITVPQLLGTLLLAGFDGLILNAPYLGILTLSVATTLEMSLIMRVFVASLPMLPLLLHWSNSNKFRDISLGLGVSAQLGFMLALWISGVAAGSIFLLVYGFISHQPIEARSVILYLVVLSSYAFFAPKLRFASSHRDHINFVSPLAATLALYYIALLTPISLGYALSSTGMVILQSLVLLLTAHQIARLMKRRANQFDTSI